MRFLFLSVFLLVGCGRDRADITATPKDEKLRVAPKPEPGPLPESVTSLVGHVGEVVRIDGTLVVKGHPRIAWSIPGKEPAYVDVDGSHLELVTHVAAPSECASLRVSMVGTVIVARGMVKSGSTSGEYAEPQLDVDRILCR